MASFTKDNFILFPYKVCNLLTFHLTLPLLGDIALQAEDIKPFSYPMDGVY